MFGKAGSQWIVILKCLYVSREEEVNHVLRVRCFYRFGDLQVRSPFVSRCSVLSFVRCEKDKFEMSRMFIGRIKDGGAYVLQDDAPS